MTNRIVLGDVGGGAYGVKVSEPGVNVLTADDDSLLLNSDVEQVQIITSGRVSAAPSSLDVTIPNLGFSPFVIATCPRYQITISYPNPTTVRLTRGWEVSYWEDDHMPSTLTYAVLNTPVS